MSVISSVISSSFSVFTVFIFVCILSNSNILLSLIRDIMILFSWQFGVMVSLFAFCSESLQIHDKDEVVTASVITEVFTNQCFPVKIRRTQTAVVSLDFTSTVSKGNQRLQRSRLTHKELHRATRFSGSDKCMITPIELKQNIIAIIREFLFTAWKTYESCYVPIGPVEPEEESVLGFFMCGQLR